MLTSSHRDSLALDGHAVVSGLVPEPLLSAARDAICSFVGAKLDQPDTWYAHPPLDWSIVPVHHAQELWDIRQWPALHAFFAELLGNEKLWVTMDRAVFKVPLSDAHPDHRDESVMHWDLDPLKPGAVAYQAMLFLTDAAAGAGAFECVPSIFRTLGRYLESHPLGTLDVAGREVVPVPARAGDLVIWDARLPHHGGPNRGMRPRVSMPVTMYAEGSAAERRDRIECWRQKRAPAWWRGWRGQVDPEPGPPAELTALGRRLAGIDRWS